MLVLGAELLVDERIAADDGVRMGLGDVAQRGADVAFLGVGADGLRQQLGAGL